MRRLLPGPAAVLALLLTVPIALSPLKNYDLFFHLAGARWLLSHGFSRQDPFSFTGTSGWVPHEWGFGILAELSLRVFGAAGPELLTATLVATFVMLAWRAIRTASSAPGLVELGVLALTLVSQAFTWYQERPYHLGHVLFALTVLLTQAWRRGNARAPWLLVPLCALWANLHGSWLLGPALLGSTAVGALMDGGDAAHRRRCLLAMGAAGLAFLAAGLSPSGPGIYLYPILHSVLASTQTLEEWQPMDLSLLWARYFLALALLAVFVCGGARPRSWAILLPTLGLTVASLGAQRHAPFAALLLALFVAEHHHRLAPSALPEAFRAAWKRLEGWSASWIQHASGSAWPFVVLAGLALSAALHPASVRERIYPGRFPLACFDTLKSLPPGKVLNRFIMGGALSYFAGPEYKVFIDSRNDPFPQPIHDDYDKFVYGLPGWREALARYSPDYVLWNRTGPGSILPDALQREGGWERLLETPDEDCVLLQRKPR
ncbi:hypothetical protein [Hyalangium gracile]|uniref:hypothetical protein n=1 Tax=Hyalangium gracile TaxID=394092 RepID=UPI001CCD062B|nr:hypothetical protein [Hyalangium gracile]